MTGYFRYVFRVRNSAAHRYFHFLIQHRRPIVPFSFQQYVDPDLVLQHPYPRCRLPCRFFIFKSLSVVDLNAVFRAPPCLVNSSTKLSVIPV